jgi:hypothetical protein
VSRSFAENLARLPLVDHIEQLELRGEAGQPIATIENKPGSAGSMRVYVYLSGKWGEINPQAAEEGLALYAEHAEDARLHPRKHPNIDRLLECVAEGTRYTVRQVPQRRALGEN